MPFYRLVEKRKWISNRHSLRLTSFRNSVIIVDMKNARSKLERKLDEVNHTMELVRTIVPVGVLLIQIIILIKLF